MIIELDMLADAWLPFAYQTTIEDQSLIGVRGEHR